MSFSTTRLVWKIDNGYAHVQLETSDGGGDANDNLHHNGVGNIEQLSSSIGSDSGNRIPESVLQYERHYRHAQQNRKRGKAVIDLSIIYEDEHILVVDKPSGVLTVPGLQRNDSAGNHDSLLSLVYERHAHPDCTLPQHMIVHRLDMDTSGLVVFGKQRSVTIQLQQAFRTRSVLKRYMALVRGHVSCSQGIIDVPLQRDHEHPPFWRVSTPKSEAAARAAVADLQAHGYNKLVYQAPKSSQTSFRVLKHLDVHHVTPCTLLELQPWTGRTHQLRIHCAALGFPIVGDPTYNNVEKAARGLQHGPIIMSDGTNEWHVTRQEQWINESRQEQWMVDQPMCLHASSLELDHPVTHERMSFCSRASFVDQLMVELES